MSDTVTILSDSGSKTISAVRGDSVQRVLRDAGIRLASPCGGRGVCGKCRVLASGALSPVTEEETKALYPDELKTGWRLACCAKILGDCTVRLPQSAAPDICADFDDVVIAGTPMFSRVGAAVDIGTTTVCVRLYDHGGFLSTAAAPNPQAPFGADVISRVGAQLNGNGKALQDAIIGCLEALLTSAAQKADITPQWIDAAVITGNTAMLCLLTTTDTTTLSRMPFSMPDAFGRRADGLLPGFPNMAVYLPPCIGPFVGADITCAMLAAGLGSAKDTVLLADIGTNGEMVLAHNGTLTACSTAAGPALEGAGISCGRMAEPGAIERVEISDGKICCKTVGGAPAVGICGSGIIDAVAALLDTEILDAYGLLDEETEALPYLEEEQAVWLTDGVSVSQKDIRMVQLAKSAICAGMRTLMNRVGCSCDEVSRLLVAGGFGKHIRFSSAARIGLIPPELEAKSEAIGNAALAGASILLRDTAQMEAAKDMSNRTKVLELNEDSAFLDYYTDGMLFGEEE